MKRIIFILIVLSMFVLGGCQGQKIFETNGDLVATEDLIPIGNAPCDNDLDCEGVSQTETNLKCRLDNRIVVDSEGKEHKSWSFGEKVCHFRQ